jgi:hypothetical protein
MKQGDGDGDEDEESGSRSQEPGDEPLQSVDELKLLYFAQVLRDVLVRLGEEQCIDGNESKSITQSTS